MAAAFQGNVRNEITDIGFVHYEYSLADSLTKNNKQKTLFNPLTLSDIRP